MNRTVSVFLSEVPRQVATGRGAALANADLSAGSCFVIQRLPFISFLI